MDLVLELYTSKQQFNTFVLQHFFLVMLSQAYTDFRTQRVSAADIKARLNQVDDLETQCFRKYILLEPADPAYPAEFSLNYNIWTIHLIIDSDQAVQHWPQIIKTILKTNDECNETFVKLDLTIIIYKLASKHKSRIVQLGITPLLESIVEPLIHFLPPLTSPQETMQTFAPAIWALAELAPNNERLNYLAREGVLKSFLHTQDHVNLTSYLLKTLKTFVEKYLKSLTIIHLHGITQVFSSTMCDPFISESPQLLEECVNMMIVVIKFCWPRMAAYKYSVIHAILKPGLINSSQQELINLLDLNEEDQNFINSHWK